MASNLMTANSMVTASIFNDCGISDGFNPNDRSVNFQLWGNFQFW